MGFGIHSSSTPQPPRGFPVGGASLGGRPISAQLPSGEAFNGRLHPTFGGVHVELQSARFPQRNLSFDLRGGRVANLQWNNLKKPEIEAMVRSSVGRLRGPGRSEHATRPAAGRGELDRFGRLLAGFRAEIDALRQNTGSTPLAVDAPPTSDAQSQRLDALQSEVEQSEKLISQVRAASGTPSGAVAAPGAAPPSTLARTASEVATRIDGLVQRFKQVKDELQKLIDVASGRTGDATPTSPTSTDTSGSAGTPAQQPPPSTTPAAPQTIPPGTSPSSEPPAEAPTAPPVQPTREASPPETSLQPPALQQTQPQTPPPNDARPPEAPAPSATEPPADVQ